MDTILDIVKAKLGRLDTALDPYFETLISATIEKLREEHGIHVQPTASDNVLVADYAVWRYQNRDQKDSMPEWLWQELKDRWVAERRINRDT